MKERILRVNWVSGSTHSYSKIGSEPFGENQLLTPDTFNQFSNGYNTDEKSFEETGEKIVPPRGPTFEEKHAENNRPDWFLVTDHQTSIKLIFRTLRTSYMNQIKLELLTFQPVSM